MSQLSKRMDYASAGWWKQRFQVLLKRLEDYNVLTSRQTIEVDLETYSPEEYATACLVAKEYRDIYGKDVFPSTLLYVKSKKKNKNVNKIMLLKYLYLKEYTRMKKNYINELESIQILLDKVRSINESVLYNEEYDNFDDEMMEPEIEEEMPDEEGVEMGSEMEHVGTEEEGMAQLDEMGAIDQIREITLKGMTKLCKTPEDAQYQAYLRLCFRLCLQYDAERSERCKN